MKISQDFFDGKTVLVFGLGTNTGGTGTLEFLLSTSAKKIIVTDQKDATELAESIAPFQTEERILWRLGEHVESDFNEADIIVKNPGIKWDHPLLVLAKENGAIVLIDSTIFMALCPVPVLGVTGSKGKTTTASVLAHILEVAGHHVVRAGISQVGVLSEFSKIQPDSVVVFELSSWRLSGLKLIEKSPSISIITNLYPDHLNYYGSMERYAEDKKIITDFQKESDTLVLTQNNEWTEYFSDTKANVLLFGNKNTLPAWHDDRALYLKMDEEDTEILQKDQSFFKGDYIFENFLAAALGARSFGVSTRNILEGLKTFPGVPHRFSLVREMGGVRYINDTTATIPAAALSSIRSVDGPVILLAGGSDKRLPLDDLVTAIRESKKAILFKGTDTDKILEILGEEKKGSVVVDSMKEALSVARECAEPGDTVLLAPGAASFGMFQNEFDRGEQFEKEVKALP